MMAMMERLAIRFVVSEHAHVYHEDIDRDPLLLEGYIHAIPADAPLPKGFEEVQLVSGSPDGDT